jgi:hypothetical protein
MGSKVLVLRSIVDDQAVIPTEKKKKLARSEGERVLGANRASKTTL